MLKLEQQLKDFSCVDCDGKMKVIESDISLPEEESSKLTDKYEILSVELECIKDPTHKKVKAHRAL